MKSVTGKAWVDQWFGAKMAERKNGVIRRAKKDIEKCASLEMVKDEARKRNWHIVELGDQWLVICSPATISLIF